MKNLLKKLHIMSNNQSEISEGSTSGSTRSINNKSNEIQNPQNSEHKAASVLSNWLNSVVTRKSPSPPSSSNVRRGDNDNSSTSRMEQGTDSVSGSGSGVNMDSLRPDSGSSNSRDPDVEEEYQIQLALELSAKEDPEAVQIEAVKQISLGSCDPENTPAEVVAYRYWKFNSLSYDDKIMDGFYDLYGVFTVSTSDRMPSLVDLQGTSVSDSLSWEAIIVNRAADANLLKLEQKAVEVAVKSRSNSLTYTSVDLVQKLAMLVAQYMGGPVKDPESMSRAMHSLTFSLKATVGSMVLPLGSLTIGLARHRALLFKVLADSVGIPCRLVKGRQYTGSDDVAMNFVRIDDGREYIVDLMADPGTLIPSDVAESRTDCDDSFFTASPLSRDIDSPRIASSSRGTGSSTEEQTEIVTSDKKFPSKNSAASNRQSDERGELNVLNITGSSKGDREPYASGSDKRNTNLEKAQVRERSRTHHPYSHARSPSWTEGVSSPAARKMKVKDVSQYMIDAAKENPQLAQKLHDVLLESGVVAPPNLFTDVYPEQLDVSTSEIMSPNENKDTNIGDKENHDIRNQDDPCPVRYLPPLPRPKAHFKASSYFDQPEHLKSAEDLGLSHPSDVKEETGKDVSPQPEGSPVKYQKDVPVAAAAVAAAAVVASSMVVAAAKSSIDSNLELPVAAAATATAAAVVATTAAVQGTRSEGDGNSSGHEIRGSGSRERESFGASTEGERISDRSAGSSKSDIGLDDVAECEIPWEEITLGDRIGLGSYGEVYRGDWHGTEVAVKKFLDQDISGESLEEFRSEVRIMKRLRHPNVVLFMGAVTRAPNLSIVTEFLPRGSLYRLIHRPNNQLDERRRLRMALDAARGMNYLHNCTPVIVHRDLKSPNLLVDKNWVVKVCDFGLSRMKHSTFLSSRSTAGTAEWMAPEVLRNEPSDEKCDVYSFGVILWELSTMQQPWGGMNPMQVVGAVGFQHRRLDIPDDIDPAIADIIRKCWQFDPKLRPTFAEIMAALKPLQKPITSSQVPRPSASARGGGRERGQPSRISEDKTG